MTSQHNHQMYLPDELHKDGHSVYDYCYMYNLNASSEGDEVSAEASKVG